MQAEFWNLALPVQSGLSEPCTILISEKIVIKTTMAKAPIRSLDMGMTTSHTLTPIFR